MFYVSRGSVPHTRHTQHRAPDGSLYAEELFGVEGFTGRSSLLYHLVPPTRVTRIEPLGPVTIETADDGSHHHRARRRGAVLQPGGDAVAGRVPLFHNADVVDGRRPPGDVDAARHLLPQRRGRRDAVRPRGHGRAADAASATSPTTRATTSSSRSARPGAWTPTRASASGCCTSSARRRSSRPSATATTTASCSSTRRTRSATSASRSCSPPRADEGDWTVIVRARGRHTAYHFATTRSTSWAGTATCGRSSFNIGDFEPITGRVHQPPPVHQTFAGAQLRRVLVRAAQVRLPPARDPGALQPLEHQQRRGHLLRRGQLHEPARRGDLVVHAPPGRHPARAAPGHGRGVDRQGGAPRSWRSWSTRSARCYLTPQAAALENPTTRTPGCRTGGGRTRRAGSRERGPEAFPD